MLHITFSKYDCYMLKVYYLFTCTCAPINSLCSHSHIHCHKIVINIILYVIISTVVSPGFQTRRAIGQYILTSLTKPSPIVAIWIRPSYISN